MTTATDRLKADLLEIIASRQLVACAVIVRAITARAQVTRSLADLTVSLVIDAISRRLQGLKERPPK